MRVLRLRLHQYRNFEQQEVDFCNSINLIFGNNGQGKTNLLEAVYLLGYGRSFRTSIAKDCVRHGSRECRLEGEIEAGETVRELAVSIDSTGQKKLELYGKPVRLEDFIGNLHVLAFTQEHLKVVRGGPAERRAFLDRGMMTAYPGHVLRLAGYARTLKQRNRLLGEALAGGKKLDRDLLDSWDEQLVNAGSPILWKRWRYVEELKAELKYPLGSDEEFEIAYASTSGTGQGTIGEIEEGFRLRLKESRGIDERTGHTHRGPHRDDLRLSLNGRSLSDFGSAGQQRNSLLSLYFAQMEIHQRIHGRYPVFLIDDVDAELDDRRLQSFLDYIMRKTQTFLTTAKERLLPSLGPDLRRYRVSCGSIRSG